MDTHEINARLSYNIYPDGRVMVKLIFEIPTAPLGFFIHYGEAEVIQNLLNTVSRNITDLGYCKLMLEECTVKFKLENGEFVRITIEETGASAVVRADNLASLFNKILAAIDTLIEEGNRVTTETTQRNDVAA
jgi:hypothetical protein